MGNVFRFIIDWIKNSNLYLSIISIILISFSGNLAFADSSYQPQGIATLTWTAPGDDGSSGTAYQYDIRYSQFPLTSENWDSAIQIENVPAPKEAGQKETLVVTGLEPDVSYYFGIKTFDECSNCSNISNVAVLTAPKAYLCGDADGNGHINVSDVMVIVNHIFIYGNPPNPLEAGEANCDGAINVSDAIHLVNYIFLDDKAPCDSDGDGDCDC